MSVGDESHRQCAHIGYDGKTPRFMRRFEKFQIFQHWKTDSHQPSNPKRASLSTRKKFSKKTSAARRDGRTAQTVVVASASRKWKKILCELATLISSLVFNERVEGAFGEKVKSCAKCI